MRYRLSLFLARDLAHHMPDRSRTGGLGHPRVTNRLIPSAPRRSRPSARAARARHPSTSETEPLRTAPHALTCPPKPPCLSRFECGTYCGTRPLSLKNFFRNNGLNRYLAERTGFEPATPGVTGRYSNQLNYRSVRNAASQDSRPWWVLQGSNLRPTACKAVALPTELNTPCQTRERILTGALSESIRERLHRPPASRLHGLPPRGMPGATPRQPRIACSGRFADLVHRRPANAGVHSSARKSTQMQRIHVPAFFLIFSKLAGWR